MKISEMLCRSFFGLIRHERKASISVESSSPHSGEIFIAQHRVLEPELRWEHNVQVPPINGLAGLRLPRAINISCLRTPNLGHCGSLVSSPPLEPLLHAFEVQIKPLVSDTASPLAKHKDHQLRPIPNPVATQRRRPSPKRSAKVPISAAIVVIMMGRNLIRHAWKIASAAGLPFFSLRGQGKVDHHNRVFFPRCRISMISRRKRRRPTHVQTPATSATRPDRQREVPTKL